MRIRNSKLAFGLSSDPHQLSRSPVVQLQLPSINNPPRRSLLLRGDDDDDDTAAYYNSHQPSDQPSNQEIRTGTNARNYFNSTACGGAPEENKECTCVLCNKLRQKFIGSASDACTHQTGYIVIRTGSCVVGAGGIQTVVLQQPTSSSSNNQARRWVDGEAALPLKKKRRPSSGSDRDIAEKDKKLKTNLTKKCEQAGGNNGNQGEVQRPEEKQGKGGNNSAAKKRGRGGALMEGSRCSRVNGRGWRCCQQTLVGYSLCEHHLGKGRLRSMTSVRSRSSSNASPKKETIKSSSSNSSVPRPIHEEEAEEEATKPHVLADDKVAGGGLHGDGDRGDEDEDDDKKKPLVMSSAAKKKAKIGMVKARSISSLLGRGNNTADDNKNPVAVAEENTE